MNYCIHKIYVPFQEFHFVNVERSFDFVSTFLDGRLCCRAVAAFLLHINNVAAVPTKIHLEIIENVPDAIDKDLRHSKSNTSSIGNRHE
jgi:hypothetical protein